MTDETPTPRPAGAARLALLLACAWLAAGALFKLLAGSPNDLPRTIASFPLLKSTWTFRLAIGTELAIVAIALLRPRLGWVLIALLFAFFDFLLYKMGAAGEKSCGCFGSSAPKWLTPFVMMVIDSALLLGLLLTRPWSRLRRGGVKLELLAVPVLLLLALPWYPGFFEEASVETVVDVETGGTKEVVKGDFHQFVPAHWQGQVFAEIDLMKWIEGMDDPWSTFPVGSPVHVILYRLSCDHCREHFEGLMVEPLAPDVQLVLILVPEIGDAADVVSDVKPQGAFGELRLRALPKGYGITTPVTFDVDPETFEVVNVVEQEEG